ncbi:MAG: arylamine N-acetyltransferase family protein [Pyrinomonadaceae bacterium]
MNIKAYLSRLQYSGPTTPNAETLLQLQVAHLQTVPFENLSIHAGEPIVLENDALYEKVITRRRGGFCYELNGLFAALLRSLGFKVDMLSAGVANDKGGFGPDFDHMALLVKAPETAAVSWLADVGFGDSFSEPLLLDNRDEQRHGERSYRIVPDGEHLILMQRERDADWKPQYRFTLEPHIYSDYQEMCHYHQTSPESHFTRGRVCTRATPEGRITLSGMRFVTTIPGGRHERTLPDENAYEQLLREEFGIDMKRSAATD